MSEHPSESPAPDRIDPEGWVDLYGPILFRFAAARLRSAEEAEEVLQQTFLAALAARHEFRGEGGEKAWLFTILKRKIVDHYRRVARESATLTIVDLSRDESLFDSRGNWHRPIARAIDEAWSGLVRQEFLVVLQDCLGRLPRLQSAVFALRVIEELGTDEVCDALGVKENHFGVLIHRARSKLAACMSLRWLSEHPQREA